MLQLKRQQQTKDGKKIPHQDHLRFTSTCGKRRHFEGKCHIKKGESEKLKRPEAEHQRNWHDTDGGASQERPREKGFLS